MCWESKTCTVILFLIIVVNYWVFWKRCVQIQWINSHNNHNTSWLKPQNSKLSQRIRKQMETLVYKSNTGYTHLILAQCISSHWTATEIKMEQFPSIWCSIRGKNGIYQCFKFSHREVSTISLLLFLSLQNLTDMFSM